MIIGLLALCTMVFLYFLRRNDTCDHCGMYNLFICKYIGL